MEINIVLSLLVFSGIFWQRSESLSEKNIDKSLDLLVRTKRIIDRSENRDERVLRQEIPYVVPLLKRDGNIHCTSTILGPRIILTAAHCIFQNIVVVASGSRINSTKKIHRVRDVFIHKDFNMQLRKNDLALLLIDEPIDLIHSFHRPIKLYEGQLPSNSHGLVTGWGSTSSCSIETPSQPLSILVSILSLQQCQNALRNGPRISRREICTHYVNRTKSCWKGDSGGPLVVNGHLVGIFSWFRITAEPEYPDIFMNLLDTEYKTWVERWVNHLQGNNHK